MSLSSQTCNPEGWLCSCIGYVLVKEPARDFKANQKGSVRTVELSRQICLLLKYGFSQLSW